jgi:ABC-type transporter Mla maintaining outer membrane lipid asymmetry ATPase subunit MlaF
MSSRCWSWNAHSLAPELLLLDEPSLGLSPSMKCVSLLRETLWSIVSEIHSTLDFDYVSYTGKNLSRFENAYEAFRQMG